MREAIVDGTFEEFKTEFYKKRAKK